MLPGINKLMVGTLVVSAMSLAIVGCYGRDGGAGTPGTAGAAGAAGTTINAAPTLNVASLTAAQWIGLNPVGTITSVTVGTAQGKPIVNFSLTDSKGNALVGLEAFTKLNPAKDLTPSYPNFTFTIAKLLPAVASTLTPGTFSAQSKWVNYMVVTTPNVAGPTSVPTGPTTDSNGTLVGHGDGTYTYTFATDITAVAGAVTAYGAANSVDVSALNPTNLVFDGNATTRVVIEFFGNARGYGSESNHANTPDGSVAATNAELNRPINITYDFVPATGAVVPVGPNSREIVELATCNNCHTVLAYHGGHRTDPKNCVTCHTDQRRFGFTEATRNSLYAFTGPTDGQGNIITEQVNGTSEFDFDQLIHQLHMGSNLLMSNHDITPDNTAAYSNTNNVAGVYAINFPTNTANCDACHVASPAAPQAGNWQLVPSRAACGGCHDATDFLTGANHVGGIAADETWCARCHTPADIKIYHTPMMNPVENGTGTTTPLTGNWQSTSFTNPPSQAHAITYSIVSATVDANSHPVVTFQILADGTPLVLNAFTGNVAGEPLPAPYSCGPNFAIAMGVPQDGIVPYDFNYGDPDGNGANWNIRQIWNKTAQISFQTNNPLLASAGIVTVTPGTYKITMDGFFVPAATKVVGLGMGISGVVETDLMADLQLANRPGGAPNFNWTPAQGASDQGVGGVMLPGQTVWTCATNSGGVLVARRQIIKAGACQSCHDNLGSFTTNNIVTDPTTSPVTLKGTNFHGGLINDGSYCQFCHMNGEHTRSTPWSISSKTWVHGLHAAGMRNVPYTAQPAFPAIIYPGKLNDCEACHVPGSYDFSNATNAGQIPGMLWDTVAASRKYASGTPWVDTTITYGPNQTFLSPNPASAAWDFSQPANYGMSAVTSPLTAACGACHDSQLAVNHMKANGGVWYGLRQNVPIIAANGAATAQNPANIVLHSSEQCLVCHGAGGVVDIQAVHMNY